MPSRRNKEVPSPAGKRITRKSSAEVLKPDPDAAFHHAFYDGLRDFEHHFDSMEFEVRKIASGWMALIFTAIAFILRGEFHPTEGITGTAPLLSLIPLFGNVGLFVLLALEHRVYHNLLNAPFLIGLQLEVRHPEIPPVRSQMWKNSEQHGMLRFQVLFYALPMCVIAIVGLVSAFSGSTGHVLLRAAAIAAGLLPVWVIARTWLFGRWRWTRFLGDPELPNAKAISANVSAVLARWKRRVPELRQPSSD